MKQLKFTRNRAKLILIPLFLVLLFQYQNCPAPGGTGLTIPSNPASTKVCDDGTRVKTTEKCPTKDLPTPPPGPTPLPTPDPGSTLVGALCKLTLIPSDGTASENHDLPRKDLTTQEQLNSFIQECNTAALTISTGYCTTNPEKKYKVSGPLYAIDRSSSGQESSDRLVTTVDVPERACPPSSANPTKFPAKVECGHSFTGMNFTKDDVVVNVDPITVDNLADATALENAVNGNNCFNFRSTLGGLNALSACNYNGSYKGKDYVGFSDFEGKDTTKITFHDGTTQTIDPRTFKATCPIWSDPIASNSGGCIGSDQGSQCPAGSFPAASDQISIDGQPAKQFLNIVLPNAAYLDRVEFDYKEGAKNSPYTGIFALKLTGDDYSGSEKFTVVPLAASSIGASGQLDNLTGLKYDLGFVAGNHLWFQVYKSVTIKNVKVYGK